MKNLLLLFGTIICALFVSPNCMAWSPYTTNAEINCVDIEYIFARGSGGELGETGEFINIMSSADAISKKYALSTFVRDLNYPAEGISTPVQIFQSYVSAGRAYSFGNSVKIGVNNLRLYYQAAHKKCPRMKFGFIGYSQGAMVVADAAKYFDRDSVVFIMLLGDPKTYLPEGKGLFPPACNGGELSSWRSYAPNCRTYEGIFGARIEYEASHLVGKYSLWCNRDDYICGSSKNPFINSGHVLYASNGEIAYGMDYLMSRAGYQELELTERPQFRATANMVRNMDIAELFDESIVSLPALSDVSLRRGDSSLYLSWSPINEAKYLLLRFNGFDLGYVDAGLKEFEIRDVDFGSEYRLELAWMDKDGNLSEVTQVHESVDVEATNEINPVMPSVQNNRPREFIVGTAISNNQNIETDNSDSNNAVLPLEQIARKNGLDRVSGFNIANIVIAMFGASGLLFALFLRRRHGN